MLVDGMVHGFFLWSITTKVAPDVIAVLLGRLGTAVADHSGEGEPVSTRTERASARSTGYASSNSLSGSSCRWQAHCSPTGAPTSSAIERLDGDPYRGLATQGIGTDRGGVNLSMALANRGKRSVALDLREPRGLEVLHELLGIRRRAADQPAAQARSNGWDSAPTPSGSVTRTCLCARQRLRCQRGPDADQPGYDSSAFWARGGVGHMLTPPERDYPDQPAWSHGRSQRRDGAGLRHLGGTAQTHPHRAGSVVDVSLLATAMWMLSSDLLAALNGGEVMRISGRTRGGEPADGHLSHEGRPPRAADVPAGRPVLGRVLPHGRAGPNSPTMSGSPTWPRDEPTPRRASPNSMRSSPPAR